MEGWSRTLIGIITLAVMVVGGWYVLNLMNAGNLKQEDFRLILRFSDAHRVPVGGGLVHKGVRVGEVLKVDISPDDSGVILEVSVQEKFRHSLRRTSRFWIVRPFFGGITQGVSGLDTLIKDPYVEYDTPDLGAPQLTSGSVVFGLNLPPVAEEGRQFQSEGSQRPRLSFTVRFAQAGGLREGALVLYRDIPVGKVLGVDLSMDGRSVEARVLLYGRYRETVRGDSVFWVARPNLEFGLRLTSMLNVQDLSKLLTGPALAYATPTDSRSESVGNGAVLQGVESPLKDLEDFEGPLVSIEPLEDSGWPEGKALGLEPVGISFSFSEEDFLGDRSYFFQGTGLLFESPKGKPLVLTARTLADGNYSASDLLGSPDIRDSDLKVRLRNGAVCEADLVWTDPEGRDLAVLTLSETDLPELPYRPRFSSNEGSSEFYRLLAFRNDSTHTPRSQPILKEKILKPGEKIRPFHKDINLDPMEWWGAVLLDEEGKIVGMVGRESIRSSRAALMVLEALPPIETAAEVPR